jgi:hypothetical protein
MAARACRTVVPEEDGKGSAVEGVEALAASPDMEAAKKVLGEAIDQLRRVWQAAAGWRGAAEAGRDGR